MTRPAAVLVVTSTIVLAASVALGQAPWSLALLDAGPVQRFRRPLPFIQLGGAPLPERTFTIDLPGSFREHRAPGGPLLATTFESGPGSPSFVVIPARAGEHAADSLHDERSDYTSTMAEGREGSMPWASRVSTMSPAAVAQQHRALPAGEHAYVELDVSAIVERADTDVVCRGTIAPYARRLHGPIDAAIAWLVGRCATVDIR